MDTEYKMPNKTKKKTKSTNQTNKTNRKTLKSILNKLKKKLKCINSILSYMGTRVSEYLNASFLSFNLTDLVIRLGNCTASWLCALHMLSITPEVHTGSFSCALEHSCVSVCLCYWESPSFV